MAVAALIGVGLATGAADWIADGRAQDALRQLVDQDRAVAIGAYFALTVVGCALLAVPGALFAIAGAALFGPLEGTLWCALAATVGAVGAFLAGRFFFRDAIRPRVMRCYPLRRWLFSGSRRNEVLTLAVTRLVPLFPFNLQNFAYGITDMPLSVYAGATFAFIIPGTALYAFGTAGVLDETHRALCLIVAMALLAIVVAAGVLLKRKAERVETAEAAGVAKAADAAEKVEERG